MKFRTIFWLAWLVFAAGICWPALQWELNYFHSPGPQFYRAAVLLLAASPALLVIWHRIRKRGLWRWEFATLLALTCAAGLLYEPAASLVVATVWVCCFAIGRRIQKLLRLDVAAAVEDLSISTALGLGTLQFALFVLGITGLYYVPAFAMLLAVFAALGWSELAAFPRAFARIDRAWRETPELATSTGTLISAFGILFLTAAAMFALAPSTVFDVLRFHLPAVQYYTEQHSLGPPPYLPYAYYPQGVEVVMTLGYALAGQAAAQLLPVLYSVAAFLVLFRIGRVCGLGRAVSLLGMLFVISTPAIHWAGASAKNDSALALFILTALLASLRWIETKEFRWILLATFFVASGAGVKHVVVFALPPFAAIFAYAAWRQPRRAWALAQVAGIFIAFGLVWHARTWIATGNPAYPSAAAAAMPGTPEPSQHSLWRGVILPYVRFPWELHFRGRRYFESASEHPMGIVLVLFAPLWVLARRRGSAARNFCLLFSAAYLVYWAATVGMIRYAIAPLALVLLLTADSVAEFSRTLPEAVRWTCTAAAAFALGVAACGVPINEINAPQLRYYAFQIDRREYLREALLPFRGLEFLQRTAKPDDSILSVNNCALAYAPNQSRFDCAMLGPSTWHDVVAAAEKRQYRYWMLPQSHAADVPGGWIPVYADSAFRLYARADHNALAKNAAIH